MKLIHTIHYHPGYCAVVIGTRDDPVIWAFVVRMN